MTKKQIAKTKPAFVAISDIHFNIQNLELSSAALEAALAKAASLEIPLIIAGDLNDTKAIIRAEVANRLLQILENTNVDVSILVGNHDLVNEKGQEHGLNYLGSYAHLISVPTYINPKLYLIPYQNDLSKIEGMLSGIPEGATLVMHQGVKGAFMGDYVQDKTSIDVELLKDFNVISGHYHRHQTIGTLTYIGSPFTMSFGEANDGDKGFLVVNQDGTFTREILNLRKHKIIEIDGELNDSYFSGLNPADLIWVKLRGNAEFLDTIKKVDVAKFVGNMNFKLDKIYGEKVKLEQDSTRTDEQVLDALIDASKESTGQKDYLKKLWRELV